MGHDVYSKRYLNWAIVLAVLCIGMPKFAFAVSPYSAPCADADEKLSNKRAALETCIGEQYSKETTEEQIQKCKSEFDQYIEQTHKLKKCEQDAKLRKAR